MAKSVFHLLKSSDNRTREHELSACHLALLLVCAKGDALDNDVVRDLWQRRRKVTCLAALEQVQVPQLVHILEHVQAAIAIHFDIPMQARDMFVAGGPWRRGEHSCIRLPLRREGGLNINISGFRRTQVASSFTPHR